MIFDIYILLLALVISLVKSQTDCPFPTCDYGIENNICKISCYLDSSDYTLEYGDPITKKIDSISLHGAYNIPSDVFEDLEIKTCNIIVSTENELNISRNAFRNVKTRVSQCILA